MNTFTLSWKALKFLEFLKSLKVLKKIPRNEKESSSEIEGKSLFLPFYSGYIDS